MAFPIDHEKVDTCMEWLGWEMDVDGWTLLLFVGSVGWAVRTRSREVALTKMDLRKWMGELLVLRDKQKRRRTYLRSPLYLIYSLIY